MEDAESTSASGPSSRRFFIALFIAIFAGASGAYSQSEARRETGVFEIDPPTPYVHYFPTGTSRGRALVVHGLDSSKEVMNLFSLALTDAGFEVYAIDLPGHGDSRAPFDGIRAHDAVAAALDRLNEESSENVSVIGHSFGATLLVDLANERDFRNLTLVSPAPTPINRIRAQRTLALAGQFDIPRIRSFVTELEGSADGEMDIRTVPWNGHSGILFRPSVQREIIQWLGGNADDIRTAWRLGLLAAMILSGCLLGVTLLLPGESLAAAPERATTAIFRYAGAGTLAVLINAAAPGMFSWLRLFATDYVVGFAFIAGMMLLVMRGGRGAGFRAALWGPVAIALLAAAYVAVIPGLWSGGNALHLVLQAERWWRLPLLTVAALPLLVADEIYIRPIRPWWKASLLAFITRAILASCLVTGALTFNRSAGFVVVIAHMLVIVSMALWFAGEFVRRNAQNAFATALFGALVQAWLFAAVFVTK